MQDTKIKTDYKDCNNVDIKNNDIILIDKSVYGIVVIKNGTFKIMVIFIDENYYDIKYFTLTEISSDRIKIIENVNKKDKIYNKK